MENRKNLILSDVKPIVYPELIETIFKEEEEINDFNFTIIEKEEPVTEDLPPLDSTQKQFLIRCPKCKKHFNNLCESLLHYQQKCNELFQCEKCNNFCKSKKQLTDHIKVKHTPRSEANECDVCGKIFKSAHNVIKHRKEVHEKLKNYFCDVCGKGFYSISPLRFHKQSHMTESERIIERNKKTNYKNNMKEMICEICGKHFDRVTNYQNHMSNHKNQCPICGLAANATNLRAHMRVHTGEKPFACTECDYTFRTMPQLRVHQSAIHLGEKKYECKICGKRLGYKFSFDAHMNRHAGNAIYKCTICPMKFYEARPLRVHKKKCHDLVDFVNSNNLLSK